MTKRDSTGPIVAKENHLLKYFFVASTVVINISAALLLDLGAELENPILMVTLAIIGVVVLLNVLRFFLWSVIHKRYDISKSYPLIAIAFPIMLVISVYQGETSFSFQNVFGSGLIILGIVLMGVNREE